MHPNAKTREAAERLGMTANDKAAGITSCGFVSIYISHRLYIMAKSNCS